MATLIVYWNVTFDVTAFVWIDLKLGHSLLMQYICIVVLYMIVQVVLNVRLCSAQVTMLCLITRIYHMMRGMG